jgi:hypothetical protein
MIIGRFQKQERGYSGSIETLALQLNPVRFVRRLFLNLSLIVSGIAGGVVTSALIGPVGPHPRTFSLLGVVEGFFWLMIFCGSVGLSCLFTDGRDRPSPPVERD